MVASTHGEDGRNLQEMIRCALFLCVLLVPPVVLSVMVIFAGHGDFPLCVVFSVVECNDGFFTVAFLAQGLLLLQ